MKKDPNFDPMFEDVPQVMTFPVVIYGTFFIIGIISDRALHYPSTYYGFSHPAGWLLVMVGIFLLVSAVFCFKGHNTAVNVRIPTTTIVMAGPYRLSRNPMYLGVTIFYAGVTIVFGKMVTLLCLIPCLLVIQYGVIIREEVYLERKFSQTYLNYRKKVRRWI